MNLAPFPVPVDAAEVRTALRRVRLPPDAVCRGAFLANALPEVPDDMPGGWVRPGVRQWWASLTAELLEDHDRDVRLIQDGRRGLLGGTAQQVSPATLENVRAAVELETDVPSSAGIFTLAWGVTGSNPPDCQGAAFSMADHLGVCLCASPAELRRLGRWWVG